jgi:cell division protein FtsB
MRRRAGRVLIPALGVAVFLGVLVIGVFPTRTYLSQRRQVDAAEAQLRQLTRHNAAMRSEAAHLQNDSAIEDHARQDFDLSKPGEEVYRILPAPPVPVKVPAVWPFTGLADRLGH